MGIIFKSRHAETGECAAIKVLPAFLARDETFRLRFEREVGVLTRLQHKNIVRLLESGFSGDGTFFYAMEFLEGETLWNRVKAGPLPEPEALKIGVEILEALDYAHTLPGGGVIHRDLKPDNIYLVNGQVKIIDYGMSKMIQDATITVTGSNFGSPAFMSPEQFDDAKTVDHRADLWSAAMNLYYALSGSLPFDGETSLGILKKFHQPDFAVPPLRSIKPDVSEHMDAVIQKAVRLDPRDRFQSAKEFLDHLMNTPHQIRIQPYTFHGTYPMSTFIEHPSFGERALVVDQGRKADGLQFIRAEFPSRGTLDLVCGVEK